MIGLVAGMARQGYMDVDGKRMLVCYTSKQRAWQSTYGDMTWDIAKPRDIMNNMFYKESIFSESNYGSSEKKLGSSERYKFYKR